VPANVYSGIRPVFETPNLLHLSVPLSVGFQSKSGPVKRTAAAKRQLCLPAIETIGRRHFPLGCLACTLLPTAWCCRSK
jgi:hypothetical protein